MIGAIAIILGAVGLLLVGPQTIDAVFKAGTYDSVIVKTVRTLHKCGRYFQDNWLLHWEVQAQIQHDQFSNRPNLATVKITRVIAQLSFLALDAATVLTFVEAVRNEALFWYWMIWLIYLSTRLVGVVLLTVTSKKRLELYGTRSASLFFLFGIGLVIVQSVPGTISMVLDLSLSLLERLRDANQVKTQLSRLGAVCLLASIGLQLWVIFSK